MTPQDTMRLALDWLDNNGGAHIADELRASLAQQCEPVAIRYDFDGYGWRYIDSGSGSNWREKVTHLDAEPLYAGAAPAAQPDTEQAFLNGYDTGYEAGKLHASKPLRTKTLDKSKWVNDLKDGAVMGNHSEPADESVLEPQAQPHVTPDQAARFRGQHLFLEWNRAQKDSPVAIAMEYHVFQNAIDLYFEALRLNGAKA